MHAPPLVEDLLIILLVSGPVAYACLRLRLPLLVGLMLTGILIGPYGLGLVKELEAIEILAEIGVMLLLFTIGLEFSLKRLGEMKKLVLVGGGLQVLLTILVSTGIAVVAGRQTSQAVFFGFLVTLSSTAIVLKTWNDRRETDAPHGRAGVGILLFQDISIVLLMLLVPVLGTNPEAGGGILPTIGRLAFSLIALVAIVAAASFVIPRILRTVSAFQNTEFFLLTVVMLFLGISWVTSQFGLSLALGAFIAGMVLSDSDYSHQVAADILPFRDVFNSVFFVSIGLLLSVGALLDNIVSVAVWVAIVLAVKTAVIIGVVRLLGFPNRVAAMTALGLAQIGEFSFVLAKVGRGYELLPDRDYQTFLAASIITMMATPFLIEAAPKFGILLQKVLPERKDENDFRSADERSEEDIHLTSSGGLADHVVIVGYGLNGRNLARVLRAMIVPYTILELSADVVRAAKEKGEKINFGDATRREVLSHAHIADARALVLATSDAVAARRIVRQAREMNDGLYIVVRTRYVAEITELLEAGANEVIPEEFETSIEIFARVLQHYGVERRRIEHQIAAVRRQGYEMLRSTSLPPSSLEGIANALDEVETTTVCLTKASPAVGRTLAGLNLPALTGASLVALIRDGETMINPGAALELSAGDVAVLLGTADNIEKAARLLESDHDLGGFNP